MLLGEYIYGGHRPLDFGSLESDDYTGQQQFCCLRFVS